MKVLVLILSALIVNCGSEPDCSKSDRYGTYLVHYEELSSGTRGPVSDSLVNVNSSTFSNTDYNNAYEEWSVDECSFESSSTITMSNDDLILYSTGITTQEDDDGDLFTGTVTVVIKELSTGFTLCTSTYALTYERQ